MSCTCSLDNWVLLSVDDIVIVSNNSKYDQFGYLRIEDDIKDSGPLAGLYSGLKHSETVYNLVLSCDIPMIKTQILKMFFLCIIIKISNKNLKYNI